MRSFTIILAAATVLLLGAARPAQADHRWHGQHHWRPHHGYHYGGHQHWQPPRFSHGHGYSYAPPRPYYYRGW